jgi:hypothetical protein
MLACLLSSAPESCIARSVRSVASSAVYQQEAMWHCIFRFGTPPALLLTLQDMMANERLRRLLLQVFENFGCAHTIS